MKELKAKSKQLKPILSIGKNGLGQGTLDLIDRELEQKELVKIKFLKTAIEDMDKKSFAKKIAELTKSELIDQVGNVIVLYRKS